MSYSYLSDLFNLYSEDLERLAPRYKNHFACPLCHHLIGRSPKLGNFLAKEHIVPRALGGKLITLTCRSCNSNDGTALDAHLVRRVRVESGEQPVNVRIRIGKGEHGAEMRLPELLGNETVKIVGIAKQSNPVAVEVAREALESGERTIRLHMNLGYAPLRSSVALVRAAYLLMFRVFGYSYICDLSAKTVLRQIKNPTEQMPILKSIMWRVNEPLPANNGVAIVMKPNEHRSFVVFLQLDATTKHIAGVMLPAPETDGESLYTLMQLPSAVGKKSFRFIPIPRAGFFPYQNVWKFLNNTSPGS